jgi:hypothetical protein
LLRWLLRWLLMVAGDGGRGSCQEVAVAVAGMAAAGTAHGGGGGGMAQPLARQLLCGVARADERSVVRILLEVYHPRIMLSKLWRLPLLRVCKALVIVVNEPAGRLLCGWEAGESRLLDYIGKQTAAMCRQLYSQEITEELVFNFLRRRFLFCALTTAGTTCQILLQLAQTPTYSAIITFFLLPITIVDRQFSMFVTKMTPRCVGS